MLLSLFFFPWLLKYLWLYLYYVTPFFIVIPSPDSHIKASFCVGRPSRRTVREAFLVKCRLEMILSSPFIHEPRKCSNKVCSRLCQEEEVGWPLWSRVDRRGSTSGTIRVSGVECCYRVSAEGEPINGGPALLTGQWGKILVYQTEIKRFTHHVHRTCHELCTGHT